MKAWWFRSTLNHEPNPPLVDRYLSALGVSPIWAHMPF